MWTIGNSMRGVLNSNKYPWHFWVRIAYNDALTFDPASNSGGVRGSWRFS